MESPLPTAHPLAQEALDGFRTRFGREAAAVWSAPGRVNLIGEHTDYNEGFVLPIAIDRRTWVAVGLREDPVARVASAGAGNGADVEVVEHDLGDITADTVSGWSAYPLGTAWALLQPADPTDGADSGAPDQGTGFDAYFTSDVPLGAGLSSSAAIECALATALAELWHLDLTEDQLLRATVRAENDIVGAPTGILDQSASLFSRSGHALFIDCRDGAHEPVPFAIAEAGLSLVVIDTLVSHAHADGGYAERRASCEQAAEALGVAALRDVTLEALEQRREQLDALDPVLYRRARHIVTEDERVQRTAAVLRSESGGLGSEATRGALGDLLVASHASMRDDFEISVPELDTAVEAALAAGAIGARMTGGGFGGSAIALIAADRVEQLHSTVEKAFADAGFGVPTIFVVSPSEGARRDLPAGGARG